MAELKDEQKLAVREWAEEGATLNDIQSRLKTELGVTLTYMECRLLAMELGLSLKDKTVKTPAAQAPVTAATAQKAGPDSVVDAEFDEEEGAELDGGAAAGEPMAAEGSVAFVMEADELTVPGMLVSGRVTFSDGMNGKWALDQMGRLSLKTEQTGYQPPPVDVPKFQQGLEQILVKKGMY